MAHLSTSGCITLHPYEFVSLWTQHVLEYRLLMPCSIPRHQAFTECDIRPIAHAGAHDPNDPRASRKALFLNLAAEGCQSLETGALQTIQILSQGIENDLQAFNGKLDAEVIIRNVSS